MAEQLIANGRSIAVAADVRGEKFTSLVDATSDIEGISAYKIGFKVGYSRLSLPVAVEYVHDKTDKLAVFDHQKAGTDIPATGEDFAEVMNEAEIDAAIIFPFTGPKVEEAWVKALQDRDITVLVGAEMTHEQIRASEGGYVADDSFVRMFNQAINLGVKNFVVPGNKPDKLQVYKYIFDQELGEGNYSLSAPGFLTQGGDISETGQIAGPNFMAIVGSGIYKAENIHETAVALGQKVLALNN